MIQLPHLETDVTQACQLSCVACNHAVPLWRRKGPWTAKVDQVYADLKHLAQFAHARVWGALGGEPLLHTNLEGICAVARMSKIADEYEVWTNGLLFHRLAQTVDGLNFLKHINRLVVSRYPDKLTDLGVREIFEHCRYARVELVIRDERTNPNFMTFLEPTPDPAGSPRTKLKYQRCAFRRGHNYAASYGYFFACCCGPHLPMLVQGRDFGDDGLLIKTATEESLLAYLDLAGVNEPFGACYSCAGRDTAMKIPWREERDPAAWLDKSAGKDGITR